MCCIGEKLSDEEVDALLSSIEDNQGQVNYEGRYISKISISKIFILN